MGDPVAKNRRDIWPTYLPELKRRLLGKKMAKTMGGIRVHTTWIKSLISGIKSKLTLNCRRLAQLCWPINKAALPKPCWRVRQIRRLSYIRS